MKMYRFSLPQLLSCFALTAAVSVVVLAQPDQSGFISIDCGLSGISNYTDPVNGIFYTSDEGYTDSGVNVAISSSNYQKRYRSVRSFPEGDRNCYTLRPENGKDNKYLIRARFLYGNYDGKSRQPEFDLYIGEDLWGTVSVRDTYYGFYWDLIHTPTTDYVHVCLQKTGETIPFISVLVLRPLNNTLYATDQSGSLHAYGRWNLGDKSDELVTYPSDVYDRFWAPFDPIIWPLFQWPNTTSLSTTNLPLSTGKFQLPSTVISTAATPQNSNGSLYVSWMPINSHDRYYLCLHFAEVQDLHSHEFRQSQTYLNGEPWFGEFSPRYLQPDTICSTGAERLQAKYELSINSTQNSTLPPIINAIEIYWVMYLRTPGTYDTDVAAIFAIKSYYRLKRNWQGDPCGRPAFRWDGLNCSDDYSPRIVSLNLSSSGLTGSIIPRIANLTSIRILDLSNNNLSGNVPDFLAQLANLTVLNLAGNNFSGPIPKNLQEKAKHGLSFSISGLPNNANNETGKKKSKVILPLASTLAIFLVFFFVFITICTIRRRRKTVIGKRDVNLNENNVSLQSKNLVITYSEILKMTNNFKRVLGKGGFGTVYHGFMGDTEVAVKMLNPSSTQGRKEFQAEANLLMNVHHKHLTSLMGYCDEGCNIGIIYEYMANGNLKQHLSELSWEQRLKIAVDAAQGLEYLHHGCKLQIVHRDIKPANILLNENFQAKLSDFGLSKAFANESVTNVSINTIAGSPGYMDPECFSSHKLTKKSDVYSFGVVLLEIVTGGPVVNDEDRHIIEWVASSVENGDIRTIVDQRLQGHFNIDSAWKVVELAMACVARPSIARPTMDDVVIKLKECLAIQMPNQEMPNFETEPNSLTSSFLEEEYDPQDLER